jgi:hypothetical protein
LVAKVRSFFRTSRRVGDVFLDGAPRFFGVRLLSVADSLQCYVSPLMSVLLMIVSLDRPAQAGFDIDRTEPESAAAGGDHGWSRQSTRASVASIVG